MSIILDPRKFPKDTFSKIMSNMKSNNNPWDDVPYPVEDLLTSVQTWLVGSNSFYLTGERAKPGKDWDVLVKPDKLDEALRRLQSNMSYDTTTSRINYFGGLKLTIHSRIKGDPMVVHIDLIPMTPEMYFNRDDVENGEVALAISNTSSDAFSNKVFERGTYLLRREELDYTPRHSRPNSYTHERYTHKDDVPF